MSALEKSADYVVVGAGPAGCVLAARLSEDPDCRVLLIEAGGRDWNPLLGVPLMTGLILRSAYANWSYVTEPEPQLNGRRTQWARGKVLGGSSSIHGMVYMRGLPIDFADWAARGLTGWSYEEVLPYFLRSENSHRGDGAFEAARYGIDRLKQIVPVWKKETRPDGSSWIEGDYTPAEQDRSPRGAA